MGFSFTLMEYSIHRVPKPWKSLGYFSRESHVVDLIIVSKHVVRWRAVIAGSLNRLVHSPRTTKIFCLHVLSCLQRVPANWLKTFKDCPVGPYSTCDVLVSFSFGICLSASSVMAVNSAPVSNLKEVS